MIQFLRGALAQLEQKLVPPADKFVYNVVTSQINNRTIKALWTKKPKENRSDYLL